MIYLFLADGFEEIEALGCVDILRRANLDVRTVAVADMMVQGAHGITVKADMSISECEDADMYILPGGSLGTDNLAASKKLCDILLSANNCGKYLAAICAAPTVFGGLGILSGRTAVCYPGLEGKLLGALKSDEKVCVSGNIITSKGPGTTSDFALKIVSVLKGDEVADKIRKGMLW